MTCPVISITSLRLFAIGRPPSFLSRSSRGPRSGELLDAIKQGTATVVEHGEQITGYASLIGFSGHAVAESNEEVKALIGATLEFVDRSFLLPARNGELSRWCLEHGLRVTQSKALMSVGLYNESRGAFLPSVRY